MRFVFTALTCSAMALPATAETTLNLSLGTADSVETIEYECEEAGPLRVQYVNAGPNALALMEIDGAARIFVNVVSGSGARYVSGADTLSTKGRSAILENQLDGTNLGCEQTADAPGE
ncbi:MliC family protein [Sulfitobacter aestuarii]|uniref:MliC family protein n=1 Tax=Sulfitobacter aestuarii TaxID=2161676 RepID=A0ABW5U4V3_9RHOB